MKEKKFGIMLIGLMLVVGLLFAAVPAGKVSAATPVYVDDDFTTLTSGWGVDHFASIQDGIDAVDTGGVVNVAAGEYPEQLFIGKTITLTGAGKATTFIQATSSMAVCDMDRTAVVCVKNAAPTIKNFTIDGLSLGEYYGDSWVGVQYADAGGTLENNLITNIKNATVGSFWGGDSIFALNDDGINRTLTINNNEIRNFQEQPILIWEDLGMTTQFTVFITDNAIYGSADDDGQQMGMLMNGWGNGLLDASITGNHIYETDAGGCGESSNVDGSINVYSIKDFNIENNVIENARIGVVVWDGPGTVRQNIISMHPTCAFSSVYFSTGWGTPGAIIVEKNQLVSLNNVNLDQINAELNWWGQATGPTPDQIISGVASVDFDPWCINESCTFPVHNITQDTYFGTIQAAIDDSQTVAGDKIVAANGVYVENIVVNKSVEIYGESQAGVILRPAISGPNPINCSGSLCEGSSNVIIVEAHDVKIHHLTVDGDNPLLTSGVLSGSVDVDARNGIIKNTDGYYNNLEVYNTTVKNIYLRGIYSTDGSFDFHHNTVTNVYGSASSIAMFAWGGPGIMANNTVSYANDALSANHSKGIQFLNNHVTYSQSGIHTDNSNDSGGVADLIQGNTVDCSDGAGPWGIWTFVPYAGPTINANIVTNCAMGLTAFGQGSAVVVQFTNNLVTGDLSVGSVGAFITTDQAGWGYADVSATFSNNSISGFENGIQLWGGELWSGAVVPKTITATFHNNSIFGNTYGVSRDSGGLAYVTDFSGNYWGSADPAIVKAGIVEAGTRVIDYTPWLAVGTDISTDAGFQGDFSTLWVDDDSPQTGTVGRIQEGINLVSGSTVNVAAGLYDERVVIDKTVTLLGATHGISKKTYTPQVGYAYDTTLESVIKPTSDIDVSVLKISADGVVVDGFVVANTSILTAGNMKNLVEFTHTFEFPTGSSLINSVIGPLTGPAQDGNLGRFGVVAPGPSSTSATKTRVMIISDNYIYDCLGNGGGIGIIGAADTGVEINTGMEITDNTITGHHRSGIEIAGMISGTSTTPVLIADNNITNNGGQLSTDAAQLKYGNGIAFIRIGSDRTNGEPYGIPQFIEISGNLIEGNEKNGIYLGPIVQNLTIEGNTIQNNGNKTDFQDWDGIRIDLNEMYYAAPNPLITSFFDDVVINKNKIVGNGALGVNLLGGVPDSGDVDATINWWGSPCGPTDSSVNGVSEHVVYSPWYVDSAMTTTAATNTTPGFYTFPTDSTTLYMNAIIACAEPGSTLTFASSATPFHGGLIVGPSRTNLKFMLNGQTVGASSPAFTIEGDNITIQGPGVLDGDGSSDPGVWVKSGADNFILDGVEVREWANGIQVSGTHASFKMASNWIHDNVGAGLLTDADMVIDVESITTIEGNLFKENGAEGVKHQGATSLDVTYNSWGDIAGPLAANGDGVSGLAAADYTPWTYSEVFVDMVPNTLATQVAVNENGTFSIAVKVDAEKLYAVQYKLTYDPAYLQFVSLTEGTFKGTGGCFNNTTTPGLVSVTCFRSDPDAEVNNALGETISTLTFRAAGTGLMLNGPWETYFDLTTEAADLSSAAIGGIKVFVNNGGFGAPSSVAGHTITDTDDGRVIITGVANFSGYIDLEGRVNDSGATITVYDQATIAGATALARGTSASSGKYTTAFLGAYQLTVDTGYWFQVDAMLYLPTTALNTTGTSGALPTAYVHNGVLETRSITTLMTVQLLGGDATDDNAIDTGDLGCIGGSYGKPVAACGDPDDPLGLFGWNDVNGDGKVDIYDLVLLGGNYDKNSSTWGQ